MTYNVLSGTLSLCTTTTLQIYSLTYFLQINFNCVNILRHSGVVAGDKDAALVEDEEEEASLRQLTLDEWKALQVDRRPKTTFNIRKPGEGCTSDPSWKKMELLKKKSHDADAGQMDSAGQFDDAVSLHFCENVNNITGTDDFQKFIGQLFVQGTALENFQGDPSSGNLDMRTLKQINNNGFFFRQHLSVF